MAVALLLTACEAIDDFGVFHVVGGDGRVVLDVALPSDATVPIDSATVVDATGLPDLTVISIDLAPADLAMSDLVMRDLATRDLATPDLAMPDLATPDLAMTDLATPDLAMRDLLATPDLAILDLAPPRGTVGNPGASCLDVLKSGGANGDGVYWLKVGIGGAFQTFCDMTTDGGGWTVCARQSFAQNGNYLGHTALTTSWGTPNATSPFGVDCADLMRAVRPGGSVEFGLKGTTDGEWVWVWPFGTQNFFDHLLGNDDTSCDGPIATECKGSATMGSKVGVSKHQACHSCDNGCGVAHRTSDSYFIYQIADAINTNVLLEIGQGDNAHPVGIRADCGGTGYWGSCGNPGGVNRAYATPDQCGSTNRVQGTVSVMFRER